MYALVRMIAVVLLVSLLTLGAVGLRVACSPEGFQSLLHESRRHEKLQQLHHATSRRNEGLQHAAEEYIAQRCNLEEAMQRVHEVEQDLSREWPAYAHILRRSHPVPNENRHYGIILTYVEVVLRGQPERWTAVRRRLEEDYRRFQAGRHQPAPAAAERTERDR